MNTAFTLSDEEILWTGKDMKCKTPNLQIKRKKYSFKLQYIDPWQV
jgi:hypothetical protein